MINEKVISRRSHACSWRLERERERERERETMGGKSASSFVLIAEEWAV